MEARFGHDFSLVRIHTEPEANSSARDVGASAYTVGAHMVFGPGRFAPDTEAGRHSIAHELAHVVQQSRGGSVRPTGDGAIEHGADRAASTLTAGGGPVPVTGASAPGLARQEEGESKKPPPLPAPSPSLFTPPSPWLLNPPKVPQLFDPGLVGAEFASRGLSMRLGDAEAAGEHFRRWYPLAEGMYKLPLMSKFFNSPADLMNTMTVKAVGTQLSPTNPTAVEAFDQQLQRAGQPTPTYTPSATLFKF
jgi:hypothetical protein